MCKHCFKLQLQDVEEDGAVLFCSVLFYLQIVEEGPVTIAPADVLLKLEHGARQLAKCVGYVGAATVEYLYSMDTQEVFFLELNPRLQVSEPLLVYHRCTQSAQGVPRFQPNHF